MIWLKNQRKRIYRTLSACAALEEERCGDSPSHCCNLIRRWVRTCRVCSWPVRLGGWAKCAGRSLFWHNFLPYPAPSAATEEKNGNQKQFVMFSFTRTEKPWDVCHTWTTVLNTEMKCFWCIERRQRLGGWAKCAGRSLLWQNFLLYPARSAATGEMNGNQKEIVIFFSVELKILWLFAILRQPCWILKWNAFDALKEDWSLELAVVTV